MPLRVTTAFGQSNVLVQAGQRHRGPPVRAAEHAHQGGQQQRAHLAWRPPALRS